MYQPFEINKKMKENLKNRVLSMGEVILFKDEPFLTSAVSCLGIMQEVGTLNDELHRHLFFENSTEQPSIASMQSELISWQGHLGVRIWSTEEGRLYVDHPQLLHLIHPEFSQKEKDTVKQIVLFPSVVSQILSLQQVDVAIIKSWSLNTVFDGFGAKDNFYVTNEWEIRQNDGLRMAGFLSRRELAFMGTHDLTAHVAGVDGYVWNDLQILGERLKTPMSAGESSSMNHLLVPYIIGVLLDDLAQPIHYGCENRLKTIEYLARLQSWVVRKIPARVNFIHFPKSFSQIIEGARDENFSLNKVKDSLRTLSAELQVYAYN